MEFLRYYVTFREESNIQAFEEELQQITKSRKNMGIIEAIKQELLEKGEKLGLEKGEMKKAFRAVEKMLKKGFSEEEIAEIIEVDKTFIQKVKAELKNKP